MMPPPTPNPEKDQAILDDIMHDVSQYRPPPTPDTHASHDAGSFQGYHADPQSAWNGMSGSHTMMLPPTPNPEKDQAILDDIMQRLSNYRTPSPTTHAPSRGDSIHGYYANPHEGDHEEQAFLNSVLEDVSVKEQQQAPSSTNGNSWFRGSLPSTHRRYPTALSFRPEDEYDKWNLKRKQDALGRRERIAHLEPASFYRLDYLPSLRRGRAVNDRVYPRTQKTIGMLVIRSTRRFSVESFIGSTSSRCPICPEENWH